MTKQTYDIEVITPCFCAGADQSKAEIRAPSIRGQLRWWFRVLGGFKSLAPMGLREQENMIFGSAAGDEGTAGKLIVRVQPTQCRPEVKDAEEMGAPMNSNKGYLLFPLRSRQHEYKGRGVINPLGLSSDRAPGFTLIIQWRGDAKIWPDIQALVGVFGHLGALGFRSRRAMGALAFGSHAPDLAAARSRFQAQNAIRVTQTAQAVNSPDAAINKLAAWLRDWRSHGRTQDHANAQAPNPPHNTGFNWAESDHDRGADVLNHHGQPNQPTFRPALGLPIVQRFSAGGTVNWEQGTGLPGQPKGRFASPVVLRPYRVTPTDWRALVIFVDALAWPANKQVQLHHNHARSPRVVSLDLYNAMKADQRLVPFP